MKKVCIIGAGNIGSRHLQGLKKVTTPLSIEVIDPFSTSLQTAKERYTQVESSINHEIKFLENIDDISKEIDLAIVATNSNIRSTVIKSLLSKSAVKYFILEKLLFQKKEDYSEISKIFKENNCKAWVDCSMRTMPFYFDMKKNIQGNIQYIVTGGQIGLITNSIHYIDHIAYLIDCDEFEVDTTLLDKTPIESKRKGFLELNGTLNVYFKDGSFGSFTCYSEGNAPAVVEIYSKNYRCISKETEKKAWISNSDNWNWEEIDTNLLFQSEMTNRVTEEILEKGECNLTPFDQSTKIHLQLLEGLAKFLNNSKNKYYLYPFT